jgi:hypothetical protein
MKEQLSILWSGLWRMMIVFIVIAGLIFLGTWTEPLLVILLVSCLLVFYFAYLIGMAVHDK